MTSISDEPAAWGAFRDGVLIPQSVTTNRAELEFEAAGDWIGCELRPLYTVPSHEGVRECATEGCGKPATTHFERGGVGSWYCDDCHAQVQALASPPAGIRKSVEVRVRELEWHEETSAREDGPREPTGDWSAATPIGEYSVVIDEGAIEDAGPDWTYCAWSPDENLGHFGTLAEAKAAAQQDYSARILSALEGATHAE
jgi:ribosomal protein L37AE/L43A